MKKRHSRPNHFLQLFGFVLQRAENSLVVRPLRTGAIIDKFPKHLGLFNCTPHLGGKPSRFASLEKLRNIAMRNNSCWILCPSLELVHELLEGFRVYLLGKDENQYHGEMK